MRSTEFIEVDHYLFERGLFTAQETNSNRPLLSTIVESLISRLDGTLSAAESDRHLQEWSSFDVHWELKHYLLSHPMRQQYHLVLSCGTSRHAYRISLSNDRNRDGSAASYERGILRLTNN